MQVVLACGLFATVLTLVIWQPRGLSIGWTATGGALAALALHVVSPANVLTVIRLVADATLTFVAVVLISLILDAAGFFGWAALAVARLAGGKGRRLFVLLAGLGALVSMFFTNDGAALILTPLVVAQARALRLSPRATLALAVSGGFIADTTSLPLTVSNLTNIIVADFFHLGFVAYALRMVPLDAVAFAASVCVLWAVFRADLADPYDARGLPPPASAIRQPAVFRAAWPTLGLLLVGYLASQALRWPVAPFAGAAAATLLGVFSRAPTMPVRRLVAQAPWRIIVFAMGMYVVVYGLRNVGLTHLLAALMTAGARRGLVGATLVGGALTAALSAVLNNLPAVLMATLAAAAAPAHLGPVLAYAVVVGADLGPKLTPIGSLATLLWLHGLESQGIRIGWGDYLRLGLILTPPVLAITLLALAAAVAVR